MMNEKSKIRNIKITDEIDCISNLALLHFKTADV